MGRLVHRLRYRFAKAPEAYGKKVWAHLGHIRTKLSGDSDGQRKGWARLLKDIAEFIMAQRHAKGENK